MERAEITTGIAGIVLAAGAGSRFDPTGRRYKLTQSLPDGRTVIAAVCEAMLPHVDTLDVVCRPERHDDIASALSALPVRVLPCPSASLGMGATLKHGVLASLPGTGWLVALGDMPFIGDAAVEAVAAHLRAGASAARARHGGQVGHPVAFARHWRGELLALGDEDGAGRLLSQRRDEIAWVDTSHPGVVWDVDFPGDLDRPG